MGLHRALGFQSTPCIVCTSSRFSTVAIRVSGVTGTHRLVILPLALAEIIVRLDELTQITTKLSAKSGGMFQAGHARVCGIHLATPIDLALYEALLVPRESLNRFPFSPNFAPIPSGYWCFCLPSAVT